MICEVKASQLLAIAAKCGNEKRKANQLNSYLATDQLFGPEDKVIAFL